MCRSFPRPELLRTPALSQPDFQGLPAAEADTLPVLARGGPRSFRRVTNTTHSSGCGLVNVRSRAERDSGA